MMELQLEREGEFTAIGMKESSNKCGMLKTVNYRYYVKIEATDEALSPEGFVIDNVRVHNYFLTRYASGRPWPAISCEMMAAKAARQIGETLQKEEISVTKVYCTIFGSNNARLTACWTKPVQRSARGRAA